MSVSEVPAAATPRRLHAYCIGAAKTGTTTVADMFRGGFRAAHEPATSATNRLVIDALEGRIGAAELEKRLRERDLALNLELEAAHPLGYVGGVLARTFPEARFIVTLREPRAWLESRLNYHFRARPKEWEEYRDYFWTRRHRGWAATEKPLEELGLCSLDTYLQQYADHYDRVLGEVPAERRLLLRTHELDAAPPKLATFLGIPAGALVVTHSRESRAKIAPLETMDPGFVTGRIWHHCRWLIEAHFQETLSQYQG